MTAFLTWLLSNPTVLALGGGIVAALLAIWRIFALGRAHGRNEQKAKEADSYAEHIRDIERAADARPRGGVHDDPYNRDNGP